MGRVVRTTNTDGTDTLAEYEGCGCVGGQVITIQGELVPIGDNPTPTARRTQKIYADILGRNYKTEVLNWDNSVYTTTVQTFNGRDQIINTRQYAGTSSGSTFQDVSMTYDGHGRMKTRHYPIEDANTNTTWIYNADDTVQQVIDPRSAITNFAYNSRGLLEQISFDPPANQTTIPDTPTVNFSYDALANRTQMQDGTGTTVYNYNSLSQITAETKTFSGLNNSFTIEYEYTLAGNLKRVKDPTDVSRNVEYTLNKAGELTTITGGGYSGVSQYLQNRRMNAFGGVKSEDYGNGLRLEQEFDDRQRISRYNITNPNQTQNQGNVVKIEYEYTASNEIKRANNIYSSNFSRNFRYDAVGRLAETKTETVSGIGSASFQSFGYDVWDNMTNLSNQIWGTSYVANYFNSYSNNRNTQAQIWNSQSGTLPNEIWQYDASGNATQTGEQAHKYDASGRKIESLETTTVPPGQFGRTQLLIQQTFDGDGQTVKRFELETFNNSTQTNKTFYYLHSTVLGGKLIAELDEQGQKQKEYVYDDTGEAIVRRENNEIRWQHTSPIGGSTFESTANGTTANGKEYDALGNEMELQPPPPQNPPDWLYSGTYSSSGNPYDGNGGCLYDGAPEDCSRVAQRACIGNPRCMKDKGRDLASLMAGMGSRQQTGWRMSYKAWGMWMQKTFALEQYGLMMSQREGDERISAIYGGSLNFIPPPPPPGKRDDLPDNVKEIYSDKKLGKKLTDCINQVFNKTVKVTRKGKTFEILGKDAIKEQLLNNAPFVDDGSFSSRDLGGNVKGRRAYGRVFPDQVYTYDYAKSNNFIPGQIYIVNDIADTEFNGVNYSAKLIKQKTYVHELGNILSLFLTGDADYFGEPGGVPYAPKPDQKDKDTGAALEKCVFDTPQMVP